MEIVGGRSFVEIPGCRTHELPPLLLRGLPEVERNERVMAMASRVVEQEELLPAPALEPAGQESLRERCKFELALQLVEEYIGLIEHWKWGDSVLEWIRQCETTFGSRLELRPLLRPDVWPHAGRASFVTLLRDKAIDTGGVALESAVGLRLAFRQPPPLVCFSDRFLLLFKATLAESAYRKWAEMSPQPHSALPPERFHFDVLSMAV
jgi:hypothetical protein